ncbi:MAG: DEAD/DEAH box helicase [Rhodospirillales bacterium]|nr:DEAD/DEAH box helicase [Rhodospirillales bacterium]
MTSSSFAALGLAEPLLRALAGEGYATPTPIQAKAIPHLLAGRDLLGLAQTGTGKTAGFALPMLQRLAERRVPRVPRNPRALVLTPTRELAVQVGDSFAAYGRNLPLRRAVIFGGVGQKPQVDALARGVDILVATPGRLLDLLGQRALRLDHVEIFVLDEADRMLDMGFVRDVKKVVALLPKQRQSMFFSATMPDEIGTLAASILADPVRVEAARISAPAERIEQRVMFVNQADKRRLLEKLLEDRELARVLVFTRTKHGANRLADQLERAGHSVAAIHGNKSQGARQQALERFRNGKARVLVATDIAARGIDIDGVTHVVNFELPNEPESYVHRIGRTARAGASGIAFSFCSADETGHLRGIEKLTQRRLAVVEDHPFRAVPGHSPAPHREPRQHRQGAASRRRAGAPGRRQPERRAAPL